MTAPLSRRKLLAMGGGLAGAAVGAPGAWAADPPAIAMGWREALVIVADARPWVETLTRVGGWEIAWRGKPDQTLAALWGLPPQARTGQTLMRNRGTTTGFIRLIEVAGSPQTRIRPDDQAWESGGINALDLRVTNMEATRTALHARGWRAPAEPLRYEVYGAEVVQWAPTSPDGVRLSFIQRLRPPLVGWSELKLWSRVANAAITVKDVAAADAFFRNTLGLAQISKAASLGPRGGANVMGLPWPLADHLAVDIRGFGGQAPGGGAIELISMPGVQGRDHARDAHPPNLGIAGLRFIVPNAAAARARLMADGAPVTDLFAMPIPPYGPCQAFAATAPGGVWLEFVEVAER
jgi:catechol 2,3-dioxygenase-like lactoylglutathione lyase family enzyme